MQDNAGQKWWYSTILAVNIISNTSKFSKMVHPDFFGHDGGRRNPNHSDLEKINDCL